MKRNIKYMVFIILFGVTFLINSKIVEAGDLTCYYEGYDNYPAIMLIQKEESMVSHTYSLKIFNSTSNKKPTTEDASYWVDAPNYFPVWMNQNTDYYNTSSNSLSVCPKYMKAKITGEGSSAIYMLNFYDYKKGDSNIPLIYNKEVCDNSDGITCRQSYKSLSGITVTNPSTPTDPIYPEDPSTGEDPTTPGTTDPNEGVSWIASCTYNDTKTVNSSTHKINVILYFSKDKILFQDTGSQISCTNCGSGITHKVGSESEFIKNLINYYNENMKCPVIGTDIDYTVLAGTTSVANMVMWSFVDKTTDPGSAGEVDPSGTYTPSFNAESICENEGIKNAAQIVGYIFQAIRWIVPLLIMVLGTMDFVKAIPSNDDKALNKATFALIRRLIAGVVIFFIPTIVMAILNVIQISKGIDSETNPAFGKCTKCIFDPYKSCD